MLLAESDGALVVALSTVTRRRRQRSVRRHGRSRRPACGCVAPARQAPRRPAARSVRGPALRPLRSVARGRRSARSASSGSARWAAASPSSASRPGYDTVGREVTGELGESGGGPDRAFPDAQGREGEARAGRAGRGCGAADDDDRAHRARRLRRRDRGDRRGARAQAGALRRARADLPPRRGPRDEHVGTVRDRDRGRDHVARSASSACTSSTRRR